MTAHNPFVIFFAIGLAVGAPLSGQVDVSIPADFPISINAFKSGITHQLRTFSDYSADEYTVRISNRSNKAVVAIVLKRFQAPAGEIPGVFSPHSATTELYLSYKLSDDGYFPLEAGETRDFKEFFVKKFGEGTGFSIIPYSVLFSDGTSVGKRQPYAYKYLGNLTASITKYESIRNSEVDPARQQLVDRLIGTLKQIVKSITSESNRQENLEALEPVR